MRKIWIFTVVFLLSLFVVSADANWETFSNDNQNIGRADPTFYNEFETADMTSSTVAAGAQFQILGADMDGDGDYEAITSNGAYVQFYQVISQTLSLEDEVLLTGTQDSIGWVGDIDGDSQNEYIVSFNDIIYTIEWNGTAFNTSRSYNVSGDGYTTETGIVCDEYAGTYACYAGSTLSYLIEYNPNTGAGSVYNMSTPDFTCANCPYSSPISFDVDADGNKEIGFMGSEEFNYIEQVGPSVDLTWTPTIGSDSYKVYGALAYNLDGAGDTETCFTWSDDRSSGNLHTSHLTCLNGDFSTFNETDVYEDLSGPGINYVGISNPVIADIDGTGDSEICVVHANQGTGASKKRVMATCYNLGLSNFASFNNQTDTSHFASDAEVAGTVTETLAAGRVRSSDREALVYGDSIFYYETTLQRDTTTSKITNASKAKSIFDSNGNGFVEIFESFSGSTSVWFTDANNTPPVVNNTLNYGGYGANFDFTNPICAGTTITFYAQECGGAADCNYNNDAASDSETLRTNCGTDDFEDSLVNGTSSLASPQYSCLYNTTGSYPTRIYIEDQNNKGDLSAYNTQTIQINVINGVSGVTCNFNGFDVGEQGEAEVTTPAQEQIDDSIETTLGLLTGTSTKMRMIIGIGLIFAILTGVAVSVPAIGTSPLIMSVISFFAVGFVTVLGLIPFWVMILLMVGPALLILIYITIDVKGV